MRFHRLNRLFALRRFDRFCETHRCQLTAAYAHDCILVFDAAAQHTLAGAVISSCLVANAPTPVSPLGSLPRFELFLLRPALATFALPFEDVRLPLVEVANVGKASMPFFPAAMVGCLWRFVLYVTARQWRGEGFQGTNVRYFKRWTQFGAGSRYNNLRRGPRTWGLALARESALRKYLPYFVQVLYA